MIRRLFEWALIAALFGFATIMAIVDLNAPKSPPILVDNTPSGSARVPDNALTCIVPEPDASDDGNGESSSPDDRPAAPAPGTDIT